MNTTENTVRKDQEFQQAQNQSKNQGQKQDAKNIDSAGAQGSPSSLNRDTPTSKTNEDVKSKSTGWDSSDKKSSQTSQSSR